MEFPKEELRCKKVERYVERAQRSKNGDRNVKVVEGNARKGMEFQKEGRKCKKLEEPLEREWH